MRTTSKDRQQQIADFYARNETAVRHAVASRAHAPTATIEDACQTAWTTLVRRPDVTLDERGLNWLIVVATHEAWHLTATEHEQPAGAFRLGDDADPGTLLEPPADTPDVADQVVAREQHDQRMADLAQLKPREAQALYLKGLGYGYREIAELTKSSYTAVNRRIAEGRAHLRRLQRQRQHPEA